MEELNLQNIEKNLLNLEEYALRPYLKYTLPLEDID